MVYVIYDTKTTRLVKKANGEHCFNTTSAAQRHLTRYLDPEQYGIADYVTYLECIEQKVERVNVMTGQKYMESINTPNYMSPASEAYWQM